MNKSSLPKLPDSDLRLCFYDEGGIQEFDGVGYTAEDMYNYAMQVLANRSSIALDLDVIKGKMTTARTMAMEFGRPFSWVQGRDVQQGVYKCFSQEHFQTYIMSKANV